MWCYELDQPLTKQLLREAFPLANLSRRVRGNIIQGTQFCSLSEIITFLERCLSSQTPGERIVSLTLFWFHCEHN